MIGEPGPRDPDDDRIVVMLERRAARGVGVGSTLGERARAIAQRDGRVGTDRVAPVVRGGPLSLRSRRAALASLVATLVVAAGLVALIGLRPAIEPLSASPSPSGGAVGSPEVTPTAPPPAAVWDAISWRLVGSREIVFAAHSSKFVIDAVAWRGGVVAIGYDIDPDQIVGRVWRSRDGTDWREITTGGPPFDHISLDRVFALGDRLVVTGRDRRAELAGAENDPGTPVAFESADGDTWRAVSDTGSPWLRPQLVAARAGGGQILAVEDAADGSGRLWHSGEGRAWSSTPLGTVFPGAVISDLAWTGERWVAGGVVGERPLSMRQPWGTGAVWTSADGSTWSAAAIDAPLLSIGRFAIGRGGIVAIGGRTGGGPIVLSDALWRSDDGSVWTPQSFENQLLLLLSDGDRIVALDRRDDQGLRVRGSFDGVDWHDVEVRGVGQFDPGHPETLDGWVFSGDLRPAVLTPGGIWALGREHVSSVEGVSDTEAELRWFGTVGALEGSATFPPRPLPGSNDTPCEPAGQECDP
ncbi:MAG: hypothetical protein A2V85_14075 [Chloroflexi bacterium RBG_16_72_14]|nr:MAG: hypothetical protein A2V85_14075 [Chloroflexi bacterium RBG_16_72_14]